MKLHIGCGTKPFPGYVNIDVQKFAGVDQRGTATHLPGVASRSVDQVYLNAVFEHLYVAQQPTAIAEWKRVLKPSGLIVVTGTPDFEIMAKLYLDRAPGNVGPRFDLFELYRYTHGTPEEFSRAAWGSWRADRDPERTPRGWLPQLHKSLFDTIYLSELLRRSDLHFTLFRYAYPGERAKLNLGFVAAPSADAFTWSDLTAVKRLLAEIPHTGGAISADSLELVPAGNLGDALVPYALRHAQNVIPTLVQRIRKKVLRTFFPDKGAEHLLP